MGPPPLVLSRARSDADRREKEVNGFTKPPPGEPPPAMEFAVPPEGDTPAGLIVVGRPGPGLRQVAAAAVAPPNAPLTGLSLPRMPGKPPALCRTGDLKEKDMRCCGCCWE